MPCGFLNFVGMNDADLQKYCISEGKGTRKGRSEVRILRRDEKIISRFYYYAEIQKFNYGTVISKLSEEFDVHERVIISRLKECSKILDQIYSEKPSTSTLRKKFPYYSW